MAKKEKGASRVGSLLDTLAVYDKSSRPRHATGTEVSVEDEASSRFVNDAINEMVPGEGKEEALMRSDMKKDTMSMELEGHSREDIASTVDDFLQASRSAKTAATKKSSGFKMSGMKFYDKDYNKK